MTATPTPEATDAAFRAVGDGIRRDILLRLRRGEQGAGEIAAAFDVSWPAVSRHLRLLKEAGLVTERRVGRERRYALNRATLRAVFGGWAAAFDAMWEDNLAALKRHVETRHGAARSEESP